MELIEVTQGLVSNLLFPAAMCLILFKEMNRRDESAKEERLEMLEVIEKNTLVTEQLKNAISDLGVNKNG